MKIVVIVLVTVLAAARAHAQAGTGMLAPWNANAHPIGASSGAEMRMPRSSSPRTSSPSFEAPHTSVVPPSTWSPAPVPRASSPSSYAPPSSYTPSYSTPAPNPSRYGANGFSSGTPVAPTLPGWNPYYQPTPPTHQAPSSYSPAPTNNYMPTYGAPPGYSATDYYKAAADRINNMGRNRGDITIDDSGLMYRGGTGR